MGDHSAVGNNHSSKKNGTATKSSKRTKLINQQSNLALKYLGIRNYSVSSSVLCLIPLSIHSPLTSPSFQYNKAGLNGDSSRLAPQNITVDEMSVADAVQSEVSRSNAFSYSNVSCLNNTASIMDQQFARLLEFVEETGTPQQGGGLKRMLQPMLCHLFLEMTKSREGKLAGNFLKKYAPLVCPDIEDCDDASSPPVLANGHNDTSSSNDNSSTSTVTPSSFKSLFKTLYGVTKKQDLDYLPDVIEFRTGSKFQLQLTSNELFLLKRYLSKYGHILILQILQSRFQIDVRSSEEDNSAAEEVETEDEVENKELVSFKTEPVQHMVNGFVAPEKIPETNNKKQFPKPASNKYYLDSLAEVVQRFNSFNLPINLHVLENATNVSSVSINKQATLIAGGFEESHILVWPVNQLPLPDQQHTRQPWSGRKVGDSAQLPQEGIKEESSVNYTCVHNEMDPEVEYNGEALVVRGHRSAVTSVLYSEHHDSVLYSTSRDCTMRLWTTNGSGGGYQCGAIYRGHNHPIWCVAESSNNLYVATGSKDATARLWVTDREFPVQIFAGHKLDIDVSGNSFVGN